MIQSYHSIAAFPVLNVYCVVDYLCMILNGLQTQCNSRYVRV